MVSIIELSRERAQIAARNAEIAAATQITSELQAEFDGNKIKFDQLGSQITRLQEAEAMAAAAAVAVSSKPAVATPVHATPRNHADEKKHAVSTFFTMVRALDQAQGNAHLARAHVLDKMSINDDIKASVGEAFDQSISMAMNTESASGGGVLVPTALSEVVIGYLFPNSAVRGTNGGPIEIPLPNGNLDIGRISGAPQASYTGRNSAVAVSNATTDKVSLKAKKLTGMIPIAKDLLRMAGVNPGVDSIMTTIMGNAMSAAADIGMLRGDGSGNNIKGIRYWAPSSNVLNATALTASLKTSDGTLQQAIRNDISRVKAALRRSNVNMTRPAFLMHSDSYEFLASLQTSTVAKVFPEVDAEGRLGQIPIGITTQLPTNLVSGGASGNGSEIYLVDFDHWLIGTAVNMEIAISYEASYTDPASGQQVNAFERDETLIRLITEHDIAPMHSVAAAVLDGVTWGR